MTMRANPGKFENALDEAVWSLSLDGGADEETGSSSEAPGTWAGIMRDGSALAKALKDDAKEYPNVTSEDRVFLSIKGAAGVILTENSDGFIKVRYYAHVADLNKDWKELEEDLSVDDDEELEPNGAGDTLFEVQIADKQCTTKWVPAHGRAARGSQSREEAESIAREFRGHGVKARVVPVDYSTNARRHRRNSGKLSDLEIAIPDWNSEWRQIGGDMNPGAHGGTIATADGTSIEVIKIQPTVEYVGEGEAKEVGFPFWSKEGYYDLDDLKEALGNKGLLDYADLGSFLEDMTPEQRAIALAETALDYGFKSDEGQAGWAKDVIGDRIVKWQSGTVQGYEYIADEDDEFRRDVLGQKYEVVVDGAHESWHEEEDGAVEEAEGFEGHVQVKDSFDGEIVWDSKESGDDEHEPNASRRQRKNSGLKTEVLFREGTLDQLLEAAAQSMDDRGRVPAAVKDKLRVTAELRRVVTEYEAALAWALDEVVMRHPPNDGATAQELFDDNAPYLVLMTLRGEGVGIWDGDWDSHYDKDQIKAVQRTLQNKLGKYADSTGGGKVEDALREAADEAASEAGYGIEDGEYVELDGAELEPNRKRRGLKKNSAGSVRWNVFLNGEMLEPVYLPPGLAEADVKDDLVAQGYDPRIVVDQPPARRTNLPPHYRTTPGSGTRMSANRARQRTKLVAHGGRK